MLDLKPEGHQFLKLREAILNALSPGMQMHTLTAFWNYILLCEIAQKVSDYDFSWADRDQQRSEHYRCLIEEYERCGRADAGDMSERLLLQVDNLVARFEDVDGDTPGRFTEALFRREIRALSKAVGEYLRHKDEVWVLVDNLDKAWPTLGASDVDVLIVRTLLDATRKLERELVAYDIDLKSLVFLRNDIYDHLIKNTSDKGKDTAIALNWDDPEVFKKIVARRIVNTTEVEGDFDAVWSSLFVPYVGTRSAFSFVLERSLMRPRDLLGFLHEAVATAINRGHDRVSEDDFIKAESTYSSNLLQSLIFELMDISEDYEEVLYGFLECPGTMSREELSGRLSGRGLFGREVEKLIDLLLWFGFLGIQAADREEPVFVYQVNYNLQQLGASLQKDNVVFTVHPAFRTALHCVGPSGEGGLPLS